MALTRREELKMLVKVKIDELSPFDSLQGDESIRSFIAADGDPDYDQVNPISSYIENSLDQSIEYCLRDLPLSVLHSDIESENRGVTVDNEGVGHITTPYDTDFRLVRVHVQDNKWSRPVTNFIYPIDDEYLLQHNRHTRGGFAKPVVVIDTDNNELALYSFNNNATGIEAYIYYIDAHKDLDDITSLIDDYVALRCASYVLEILGDAEKAGVLMTEYENKKKVV